MIGSRAKISRREPHSNALLILALLLNILFWGLVFYYAPQVFNSIQVSNAYVASEATTRDFPGRYTGDHAKPLYGQENSPSRR